MREPTAGGLYPVFSLGCCCTIGGCWTSLFSIVQIYPPISVLEAAALPINVMVYKADLYSRIITEQFYTCKCTAINFTIVMLAEDRDWIRDWCFELHPLHSLISKF